MQNKFLTQKVKAFIWLLVSLLLLVAQGVSCLAFRSADQEVVEMRNLVVRQIPELAKSANKIPDVTFKSVEYRYPDDMLEYDIVLSVSGKGDIVLDRPNIENFIGAGEPLRVVAIGSCSTPRGPTYNTVKYTSVESLVKNYDLVLKEFRDQARCK